jgi:hypothetical protein
MLGHKGLFYDDRIWLMVGTDLFQGLKDFCQAVRER